MLKLDDVISKEFFSHVAVVCFQGPHAIAGCNKVATHIISMLEDGVSQKLRSGPYFLHGSRHISKVYRLYQDTHQAFMFGVTRDTKSKSPR